MTLLDASAVLAYLCDEPGRDTIEAHLLSGQASISMVNMTEVLTMLLDWGGSWEETQATMNHLALTIQPYSADIALEAARLRPGTKANGLSLGDRACLATARLLKQGVVTGDRAWLDLAEPLALQITNFRPSAH